MSRVLAMAAALALSVSPAAAQQSGVATPRLQSTQPSASAEPATQQQRRTTAAPNRPRNEARTQRRPQGGQPPAAAVQRPAGQPGQRPVAIGTPATGPQGAAAQGQSGNLNLDLGGRPGQQRPVSSQAGSPFATSGPYASDAQMQRYTGRRQINMPQAPINIFGNQQSGPVWTPQ